MDINFPPVGVIRRWKPRNEIRTALNWRGSYKFDEAYTKNDLVEFQDEFYVCAQDYDQVDDPSHPRNSDFWKPLVVWAKNQFYAYGESV
jgi:hypothetical protein